MLRIYIYIYMYIYIYIWDASITATLGLAPLGSCGPPWAPVGQALVGPLGALVGAAGPFLSFPGLLWHPFRLLWSALWAPWAPVGAPVGAPPKGRRGACGLRWAFVGLLWPPPSLCGPPLGYVGPLGPNGAGCCGRPPGL